MIVHIADTNSVYELAEYVPEGAKLLMEAFWPGPLTIIFKKKSVVPDTTTGGLNTVAIRMPSHPGALKLIKDSGYLSQLRVPTCQEDLHLPQRHMLWRI